MLLLVAVCVRAYPIQVHDNIPYEAPQHHAHVDHYLTQEQGHDVEVYHNVSDSFQEKGLDVEVYRKVSDTVSGTGTRCRGLPQRK